MSYRDPAAIKRALLSRTWAVVGLTRHEYRAAYTVAEFLQTHGRRIVPVNPLAESVLGENATPTSPTSSFQSTSSISSVARTGRAARRRGDRDWRAVRLATTWRHR